MVYWTYRNEKIREESNMRCQVCGLESGKYPLCRACNEKKEKGEIIKCPRCGRWHYADAECRTEEQGDQEDFLYALKSSLVTENERKYLNCIRSVLPENCLVQVQANLATFITRTDHARYQNELYRNVDFLITDLSYRPLVAVEINDQTHQREDRKERDRKVANICEEAGIPLITLWTSYGVNPEYIKSRIEEAVASLPVERVHHFAKQKEEDIKKEGCYIATCVYGSYDCPQVWVLRRFRDGTLRKTPMGRLFVKFYYAVSPALVRKVGEKRLFRTVSRSFLDALISRLRKRGVEDTPYEDKR